MSTTPCINPYCDRDGVVQVTVFDHRVGDACEPCSRSFASSMAHYARLEAIVRDLAARNPNRYDDDGEYHGCMLCAAVVPVKFADHDPSCPWRRASEWVAQHPTDQGSNE